MLKLRIISALVLAPLVIFICWLGGWPFKILLALAGGILASEWLKMCACKLGQGVKEGLPLLAVVSASVALVSWDLGFLAIVSGLILTLCLVKLRKIPGLYWLMGGMIYITLPIMAMSWLRDKEQGEMIFLWLLLVVWATDTGAYFAGRLIGGPKLAPSISPSKTWSGLTGGMLLAALVGIAMVSYNQGQSFVMLALFSAFLAVIAQTGDLLESKVKRYFGVKDSGNIIPGHGGLFDRVDGLLTAAPTVALWLWLKGGETWL